MWGLNFHPMNCWWTHSSHSSSKRMNSSLAASAPNLLTWPSTGSRGGVGYKGGLYQTVAESPMSPSPLSPALFPPSLTACPPISRWQSWDADHHTHPAVSLLSRFPSCLCKPYGLISPKGSKEHGPGALLCTLLHSQWRGIFLLSQGSHSKYHKRFS